MPTMSPSPLAARSSVGRIGMLSTFPPQLCGLATFAAALSAQLRRAGSRVDVVRITDDASADVPSGAPPVVAELVNGDAGSIRRTVAALSRCDVAIIQHEYGIFGGRDGDEVIGILRAVEVPTIVVLHTVPLHPSTHQKFVLEAVCRLASHVIVMADAARARLVHGYSVDEARVVMIPHGASLPPATTGERATDGDLPPQLLTWGLLGPGKGIEHVIDALGRLGDLRPPLRYTVAGVTHPKVLIAHGDDYRRSLIRQAAALLPVGMVEFDDSYRDLPRLTNFVASATAVVLPYDSRDQITSGVLVDAIAAGRPVIATAFPHATELLRTGAGIVVPHDDPAAMAEAIRATFADGALLASMSAEARRLARSLSWPAVAARYVKLCEALVMLPEPVAV